MKYIGILFILLVSCKSMPFDLDYADKVKKQDTGNEHSGYNYSQKEEIVAGVYNPSDLSFQKRTTGNYVGSLENLNDKVYFELGKPFEMRIKLNSNNYDLVHSIDPVTKTGSIQVVERGLENTIYLKNKCQIVNISSEKIPKIIPSKDLALEQVIITPRYTQNCEFIGYEIRYGSTSRGCNQGKTNLNQLYRCREQIEGNIVTGKRPETIDWGKEFFGF